MRIPVIVAAVLLAVVGSPQSEVRPDDGPQSTDRAHEPLIVGLGEGEEGTAALSDIVGNFTAATGIPARLVIYRDAEFARWLAGAEGLPEVLVASSEALPFLADAGRILALDDHVASAVWDDFVPRSLDSLTYRGRRWAVPLEGNPYGLFCNLALFHDAGVEQVPRTWEQTLAAAERILADTDGDGAADRYGYTQCTFQLPLLLLAYGCDFISEDGADAGFDNPAGLEAMKTYVRLRDTSPHIGFEHGDIGMKVSIIGNLDRYAHLDFDVVGLPQGTHRANTFGGSWGMLCVAATAGPRAEQALEFVRFILRPSQYLRWCTATGDVPLRRSVLDSWAYRRFLAQRPRLRAFVDELPYCRPRPCIRAYPEIKDALAQASHQARALDHPTDEQLQDILSRAAQRVRDALAREL